MGQIAVSYYFPLGHLVNVYTALSHLKIINYISWLSQLHLRVSEHWQWPKTKQVRHIQVIHLERTTNTKGDMGVTGRLVRHPVVVHE